jgi:hypothetical protein
VAGKKVPAVTVVGIGNLNRRQEDHIMSGSDEQRNAEPQEPEDLELDDEQSDGVQGGFASQDPAKQIMADSVSPAATAPGYGRTGGAPKKA